MLVNQQPQRDPVMTAENERLERMTVSAAIIERIHRLIIGGMPLSTVGKRGEGLTDEEQQDAQGWLTSADHVLQLVIREFMNPYRQKIQRIVIDSELNITQRAGFRPEHIDAVIGILRHLLQDIDAGLITTLADRVRAEVFDDFLDHAEEYHKQGRKESGVIAGVVFEDSLRRIADKFQISERKADGIISALVKKDVFTDVKAKRARAAADVRTKALTLGGRNSISVTCTIASCSQGS
jgi:hypothetical protein